MNNINLNEIMPSDDSWLVKRENGMILSDYQIEVLSRNGIDYLKYGSINSILLEINEILEEGENEELEVVAREIDEKNYYYSKKN